MSRNFWFRRFLLLCIKRDFLFCFFFFYIYRGRNSVLGMGFGLWVSGEAEELVVRAV